MQQFLYLSTLHSQGHWVTHWYYWTFWKICVGLRKYKFCGTSSYKMCLLRLEVVTWPSGLPPTTKHKVSGKKQLKHSNFWTDSTCGTLQVLAYHESELQPFKMTASWLVQTLYIKSFKKHILCRSISTKLSLLTIHHLDLFHNFLFHRLHFGFCSLEQLTPLRQVNLF